MRNLFHVPENYFLNHSVGCLPRGADIALADNYFAAWTSGTNWDDWMDVLDEFRSGLAELLGVKAASICPQSNVSSALTKILYSLPENGKKTILLSRQDFPTIGFVFKQAERMGFRLKFVDGDPAKLETWERAMEDDIAIIHITHALSNTSHLLPAREICALARKADTISIVDIAQSFGVVPVPLAEWGADFAIGTGVKYLCFGPGACFLYAAPHILPQCQPIDVGWFSHENPFEMNIHSFRYAEDAMRFFGGTPSPAPLVLANHVIKLWQRLGLETVHSQIDAKLRFLCDKLPEDIIISPTQSGARGGTLVISPPNKETLRLALSAENFFHDERAEGFRFSLHSYTLDAETKRLAKVISESQGI